MLLIAISVHPSPLLDDWINYPILIKILHLVHQIKEYREV
jgi:hypothetical protein